MFLRATIRKKHGKEHRYWSIFENKRISGSKVRQRHVLYLGEINASQERSWRKSIEVLDEIADRPRSLAHRMRPRTSRSASHSASLTSVLRPGTFLTCAAFAKTN
jgi:hypothetical protein